MHAKAAQAHVGHKDKSIVRHTVSKEFLVAQEMLTFQ